MYYRPGGERLSGLNGKILDEMFNNKERDLLKSTSTGKTGHLVEGCSCYPTSKNSGPKLFWCKRNVGTKMEKKIKAKGIQ